MTSLPLLIVLAGRPGTGKTTLTRRLSAELRAVYLRIDAVETAVIRCGLARAPVGPIGYAVVHEIAAANLALGMSVVVDAVNPVPEARSGWQHLSGLGRVVLLETTVPDEQEHRRRVTARTPDMLGQAVPRWTEVLNAEYAQWDEERDGLRTLIDMTDTERAVAEVLELLASDEFRS